jgi:hypothetical protein
MGTVKLTFEFLGETVFEPATASLSTVCPEQEQKQQATVCPE